MTKYLWRNDPNVATIWHNIGDVHRATLRSNLAIICFERALAIRREYFYESDVRAVRLGLRPTYTEYRPKFAKKWTRIKSQKKALVLQICRTL